MTASPYQMAKDALAVQDACNLSGVVHGFARLMQHLCDYDNAHGKGTTWRNEHPLSILWADKIAHLTGTQGYSDRVIQAFQWTHNQVKAGQQASLEY